MKILLIGGGGREHSLAWKISQSPLVTALYAAPGSDAIARIADCYPIAPGEVDRLAVLAEEKSVDLVVVGPEVPLAAGLADRLKEKGIACFGPGRAAAQLESSKGFVKQLCDDYNIPTARYGRFSEPGMARDFLKTMSPPYVIKADGLAEGKGVVIADTLEIAEIAAEDMLGGKFGTAGSEIVIEEFLRGEEASFFVITDGEHALPLIAAQDHKRAFDGDLGPNTGGMGAYSPAPVFSDKVLDETMTRIILPTIRAMKETGHPYCGVLYAGLMITGEGPKLIEYNARFGDPECQVLMRRMESDIVPLLKAAAEGTLADAPAPVWTVDACALIVMAAEGYPGSYQKGSEIRNLEVAAARPGVEIFHAGTRLDGPRTFANGGRVLNITATGESGRQAILRAYDAVGAIDWPDGFFRKDIGWRLLEREENDA